MFRLLLVTRYLASVNNNSKFRLIAAFLENCSVKACCKLRWYIKEKEETPT